MGGSDEFTQHGGWIGFAGIICVLLGAQVFQGLIALLEDTYYVPTTSGYLLFAHRLGWIMLIWAVILRCRFALLTARAGAWVSIVL
jgi:hypothetical protein